LIEPYLRGSSNWCRHRAKRSAERVLNVVSKSAVGDGYYCSALGAPDGAAESANIGIEDGSYNREIAQNKRNCAWVNR
jgi:hypothetical protein